MKTPLLFAVATLALALTASADDQLRNVQTALKNQGFYYGDVDGQSTGETTSALRRYQIRNGLEVTGSLTPETLSALGLVAAHKKQPASAPAATAQNPPSSTNKGPVNIRRDSTAEESDKDFLRKEEFKSATNNQPPPPQYYNNAPQRAAPSYPSYPSYSNVPPPAAIPRDNGIVPPPAPLDAPSADFPVLFAGTPYASAPPGVQRDTLRRAQSLLSVQGFYRDIVDGLPGPATEEALLTFQRAARMTLTGRLDLDTLNKLRLLPGTQGPGAQFGIEFRSPRHVFRGVWVERD
jgi:peptidoglycan hydrolase-like protein with peptidoglycan-binding domain